MKFGIVGTNFVSDFFMSAAQDVEHFEASAVCSGRKENAIRFAEKYNIPHIYDNLDDMIASKEVDVIYLATPNVMHKDMAKKCLANHIPCMVEKPFACSAKEVSEIIACSHENQTYVHDSIIPLYTNNFQRLKEEIKTIGKIRQVVFVFEKYSSRYDAYLAGDNPTTFRKELCNGSLMDLGVYAISVAVGLFGKPKDIHAQGVFLESGVDGCGSCIFKYDDFEVVILHSKITNTSMISEIQGEKGQIQIDILSLMPTLTKITKENKEVFSVTEKHPFSYQITNFIQGVEAGNIESDLVPHQLSQDIHDVITECRKKMNLVFDID